MVKLKFSYNKVRNVYSQLPCADQRPFDRCVAGPWITDAYYNGGKMTLGNKTVELHGQKYLLTEFEVPAHPDPRGNAVGKFAERLYVDPATKRLMMMESKQYAVNGETLLEDTLELYDYKELKDEIFQFTPPADATEMKLNTSTPATPAPSSRQ